MSSMEDEIARHPDRIHWLSDESQDDYNIIMTAIKHSKPGTNILQYASQRLRDNFDIVMSAVKKHGQAIEYASERLRDNYDIMKESIKNNCYSYDHASEGLKNNIDLAVLAFETTATDDADFYYIADIYNQSGPLVQQDGKILNMILSYPMDQLEIQYFEFPESVLNNWEYLISLIIKQFSWYKTLPVSLQKDKEFVYNILERLNFSYRKKFWNNYLHHEIAAEYDPVRIFMQDYESVKEHIKG